MLLTGFRAVSDDDYSRVVIAEAWARAPRLDPSGTSWLPFPFWLTGGAMLAFGRSLFVAQATAIALGIASSLLVHAAALRITGDRRSALIAGCFATLLGWSAWLGVATVPELATSALTLFAASTLVSSRPRDRAMGALALVCATLSRYEPWPIALAFAAWNLIDPPSGEAPAGGATERAGEAAEPASRPAPHGAGERPESLRNRTIASVLISLAAIAGPVAWIAWNRIAHGDALHFVARVTAYRRALGDATNEGVLARLVAYPVAFAREMPEVAVPFLAYLALAASPRIRAEIVVRLRRHRAPLLLAVVQIVALAAALVKDGAPTHHPERAVLFPAFVIAVFVSDAASSLTANIRPAIPLLLAAALLARAVMIPITKREAFAQRDSEVAIGALLRDKTKPSDRVMIEATDYGYFAVQAASGRPEMFELDRDLDPRHPSPPPGIEDPKEYAQWLRERHLDYLVSPLPVDGPVRLRFERGMVFATSRHALSQVPPSE